MEGVSEAAPGEARVAGEQGRGPWSIRGVGRPLWEVAPEKTKNERWRLCGHAHAGERQNWKEIAWITSCPDSSRAVTCSSWGI